MARSLYLQNNFTGGQVSSRIDIRSDLTRHKNGLKALENMTIMPQGGVTSRTGSVFVAEVKDSTKTTILIPFEASTDDAFIIEMGPSYFRFYKNGAQVESGGSPYEVAHTYTEAELSDIRWTQSADVLFINHGDHPQRELGRVTDTNWTLAVSDVRDGPYLPLNLDDITLSLSGTSGLVTVTASSALFSATDTSGSGGTGKSDRALRIQELSAKRAVTNITQATECRLTYSGDDSFAAGDTILITGVVGMTELNDKTFEIERVEVASNYIYLKDVDSTGFTAYTSGGDIQLLRDKWTWLKIKSYSSTTSVTAEIQDGEVLGTTGGFINFRLGAWSTTTGYPKMSVFYENRLVSAGTRTKPDTVWASALDDFTLFSPSDEDDGSWNFTLLSNKLDAIQWLSSQRQLRVGTLGSEYTITGGTGQSSITPTSIDVKRETQNGSASTDPAFVQTSTVFLQRAGRKIREFTFSFDVDGFIGVDLSLAASDLMRPAIDQLVYQQEPDSILWARRTDGVLLGLTYMRDQDVVGWHRHTLGGTDVEVKSIASIPTSTQDRLWMIVERTVDGSTVQYVEYLGDQFVDKEIKDAVFVDSSVSATGSPISSVSGLGHLEGEEVSVLVDGGVHPNVTVSGGSITLNGTYTDVHVGLPYTQKMITLNIDSQGPLGTSLGSRSRITTLVMRFFETVGAKFRVNNGTAIGLDFRKPSDLQNQGVPLFTGEKEVKPPRGWADRNEIEIVQDQPLPMTLLGYVAKMETSDAP